MARNTLINALTVWCWVATVTSFYQPAVSQSSTDLMTRDKSMFNIRTWDDIETYGSKYPLVADEVNVITTTYFATINVTEAMTQLARVGRLLQLAYSGSKGFPSSPMILDILLNYQSLVKDSVSISSHFVESSLKALKYHKLAMIFAYKEKFTPSLNILKLAFQIAQKMTAECDKLIALSETLIEKTRGAAVQAVTDEVATKAQKNATLARISRDKAAKEQQKKRLEELQKAYNEQRDEALKAERDAKKNGEEQKSACKQNQWDVIVSMVTFGMINNKGACNAAPKQKLNNEAIARQKQAEKMMMEYRQAMIESNAKEAGLIESLLNAKVELNDLNTSILSLEVSVATLGRVVTIFQNTRLFWNQVQRMAESRKIGDIVEEIANVANVDPEAGKEEFINEIRMSGFGWIGLATVNRESAMAIRRVNNGVDKIVTNLPTQAEAKQLINTLGKTILNEIKEQTQKIVDASSKKPSPKN